MYEKYVSKQACHCTDFHKTHACSTTSCKNPYTKFQEKNNKQFSHQYYVTDREVWSSSKVSFLLLCKVHVKMEVLTPFE